jgi:hypothetical protein
MMDLAAFLRHVEASPLATRADWVRRWCRPAIDITRSAATSGLGPSGSRFGGSPDLEAGADWPRHEKGPYRFLAQIDLAELAALRASFHVRWAETLPTEGLLSLFVADDPTGDMDPEGEIFWGDPRYAIARLSPPGARRVATRPPPEVDFGEPVGISFAPAIDIPFDRYQVPNWPFRPQEAAAYEELRAKLHGPDYLFGYPAHCSLGYDPTPAGQIPLLTVASNDPQSWEWHDGDYLMLFFDPSAPRIGTFSLGADAG